MNRIRYYGIGSSVADYWIFADDGSINTNNQHFLIKWFQRGSWLLLRNQYPASVLCWPPCLEFWTAAFRTDCWALGTGVILPWCWVCWWWFSRFAKRGIVMGVDGTCHYGSSGNRSDSFSVIIESYRLELYFWISATLYAFTADLFIDSGRKCFDVSI